MAQANPPKILLSSIFLIVAIVLGYFFVWPQYTEYQQKLQELAAKNTIRKLLRIMKTLIN